MGGAAGNSGASGVGGSASGSGGAAGESSAGSGGSGAGGTAGTGGTDAGTGGHTEVGGTSGVAGAAGAAGSGPAACTLNRASTCTGTNPIECHLGGEPGDYEVTVELGGATAGDTIIEAESHRRVLGQVSTAAGETRRFSFFVNVRQPEGQPIQNVPAGTPGLDVYIRGTAPQLSALCFEAARPASKVWVAGDSTVCDQDGTDYAGWGQHLPQFFRAPVSVANYADSGESSGSFLGSGKLWGAIRAGWSAGDWVLIQLGHNDKEVTATTFRSNLTTMVTQAKAASVSPVLLTPIARAGYALADQHVNSTGANLPEIVREIAQAQGVPVIDLTVTTSNWLETVDWKTYFALGSDRTHTNPAGAAVIAGFVRDGIREQGIGLAQYLR